MVGNTGDGADTDMWDTASVTSAWKERQSENTETGCIAKLSNRPLEWDNEVKFSCAAASVASGQGWCSFPSTITAQSQKLAGRAAKKKKV